MEERIVDDPRKIKVKKKAVQGIADVTDELAPQTEEQAEEELYLELPEDETDEDLIGLSPEQLRLALEKREKAAEEARKTRDQLLSEGEEALTLGKFAEAEGFFIQAQVYDADCRRAKEGVWLARTRHFKDLEPLYLLENAQEIAESDEETKQFVRKGAGEALAAQRKEYEAEEKPLAERFFLAQETRREKFAANRNYWLARVFIAAGFFVSAIIALGVSASFLYKTNSPVPIILIACFGGLAVVLLGIALYPLRKLAQAQSLCNSNGRLSSTEDGARLKFLQDRLLCLKLILDD